jgi:hypothetical protein
MVVVAVQVSAVHEAGLGIRVGDGVGVGGGVGVGAGVGAGNKGMITVESQGSLPVAPGHGDCES